MLTLQVLILMLNRQALQEQNSSEGINLLTRMEPFNSLRYTLDGIREELCICTSRYGCLKVRRKRWNLHHNSSLMIQLLTRFTHNTLQRPWCPRCKK